MNDTEKLIEVLKENNISHDIISSTPGEIIIHVEDINKTKEQIKLIETPGDKNIKIKKTTSKDFII